MEKELGQSIVIDNRGGANGILGADTGRQRDARRLYAISTRSFGFAVNKFIVKKLPFDLVKDFPPVTNVALGTGYLMVANLEFPAEDGEGADRAGEAASRGRSATAPRESATASILPARCFALRRESTCCTCPTRAADQR